MSTYRWVRLAAVGCFGLAALLLVTSPSAGQEAKPTSASDDDKFRYVLAGIQSWRAKLQSGSCEIRGNDRTGSFAMTFHFDGDKIRCDRKGGIDRGQGIVDDILYFAKNGKTLALYQSTSNVNGIQILKSTFHPNGRGLGFWDLRTSGLGLYPTNYCHSLDEAIKYHEEVGIGKTKVSKSGAIWTLTTYTPDGSQGNDESGDLDVMTVDEAKGFGVTLMTGATVVRKGGKEIRRNQRYHYEASWEQVNGVWVTSAEKHVGNDENDMKYSIGYKWLSVNESFDPALLHYNSFPLPPDTPVIDYTLGRGRRIDRQLPGETNEQQGRSMSASGWRRIVGFTVGISLFLVGSYLVLRKRGPATKQDPAGA